MPSNAVRAIFWGGLIAGTLDITDAFVFFGIRGAKPIRILQSIASGVLGPASFQGGWASALLGAALHFVIAFGATIVYYTASRRLRFLTEHAVVCGLLYGGAVYLFMNRIVLPLSRVAKPAAPPPPIVLVNGVLAVMLCVGLTIALVVRWYSE
ncbi:MAG TPA: hypothetical protein VKU19_37945 [Bryobacteraceae bacterium]|nr:hypothetical protein [Bryobacteraceae bacterium]